MEDTFSCLLFDLPHSDFQSRTWYKVNFSFQESLHKFKEADTTSVLYVNVFA